MYMHSRRPQWFTTKANFARDPYRVGGGFVAQEMACR